MNDDNKPCPFCGSDDTHSLPDYYHAWSVECGNCDAQGPFDNDKNAAWRLWNTRAAQPDGHVSDGYHTFDELYEHRHALFLAVCRAYNGWKSLFHDDGTTMDGWFIAGVDTPLGMATYHLPSSWWRRFAVRELDRAPKWDGHTSQDVIERLQTLYPTRPR